jgi:hypothetical protein
LFWEAGSKISVPYENIIRERAIACICWKWEGRKPVYSLTWDEHQCDKAMIERFIPVMNQADERVAHFGDGFDVPWVLGRMLFHNLPAPPPWITIDTYKVSKRFGLNSRRLDYLGTYCGVGKKIETKYQLWWDITVHNDPKALRKMVRYCKQDVRLLEAVWDRMNPFFPPRSSRATYLHACPECGSENTTVQKHRVTAAGHKMVQFQCQEPGCGKYHQIAASRFDKSRKARDESGRGN